MSNSFTEVLSYLNRQKKSRPMPQPISEKRKALLREMISIVSEVYNDYVQNYGPGGIYEGAGRHFSYPTRLPPVPQEVAEQGHTAIQQWADDHLMMRYFAFGANQMPVYSHMNAILTMLEERYGLDIENME